MPQWFHRGRGLGLFAFSKSLLSRKTDHDRTVAPVMETRVARAASSVVENLESRTLLSTSYFVAPYGSDNNPGSISAPFKTIQRAANSAVAGDHVEIRAGTYHETVTPLHSGTASAPIVFEAYNNENVTLTGADPVTNWVHYSGNIYRASMPWTLGEGKDQVFVDGQMVNEARFPNTGTDVSHPTLAHAQSVSVSGSTATIYDSSLNQPAGYWNGALIHIAPGQAWVAQVGTVTSSAPGRITFTYTYNDSYEVPKAGNAYYLTGKFQALDSAGEWFRDSGGNLYAWMPRSDSPASHDVEAKHRLYAFELSSQHDITIQNVHISAATIHTSSASYDTVLNHIDARYLSQYIATRGGWDVASNTGIELAGAHSVLENSTIAYSAGDGVFVLGSGSRVTNNIIHDVDYSGGDAAAVRLYGATGVMIDHNTIYNTGRSGIRHPASGEKILYNTIHDVGLQTTEAGGTYTVNVNGGGTEIAYNNIYGFHSGGFGSTGIFLDNNSSGYYVHNNNVSNVDTALKMNAVCRGDTVVNNTLGGSNYAVFGDYKGDWSGSKFTNNVFLKTAILGSGAASSNNSYTMKAGVGSGDFASGATVGAFNPAPTPAPAPVPTPAPAPAPTPAPAPSTAKGSISGTYFYDTNGNGVWNTGEPISASWLIYLDNNKDGKYDAGDLEIRANSAGQYSFSGLAAGTYTVRSVTASGWTITAPASNVATVTVAAGQNVTGINFGVVKGTVVTPTPAPAPAPAPTPTPTTAGTRSAKTVFQAEKWDAASGVAFDTIAGLGYADGGDWAEYKGVDFGTGVSTFKAAMSALSSATGYIELHVDSPTGALIGAIRPAATGSWSNYTVQTTNAFLPKGVHDLYIVFKGGKGVANIDWFTFA